ncbi:hypothetical protein [Brachybacterium paraconglomeratum]|nr:hypothetical protein [Brachybacterium paraconglomeratum]
MQLGRGPRFEKDSNDLAGSLSGGGAKLVLFVVLAIFAVSLLIGVLL